MRFRKLVVVLGLIAMGWTQFAFSLGLGEITLKSALNQPLNAEIRLLQVRDLTASDIRISLASQEVFREYGVERPFFLQDLIFEVQLNSASGPIVKITSRQPIREPFINFIIELQSPNARLMREYTLLMDLPVFDDRPAAPVQRAQTPTQSQPASTPAPAPRSQPTPAQTQTRPTPRSTPAPALPTPGTPSPTSNTPQQVRSQPPRSVPVSPGADSYTVRNSDTLWEIALAVRPDRGVSVQQTMLALQRLNPDAFINDNINLLRSGQVLRIPERDEILALNQRQAINEVAVQNNEWQGSRGVGAEIEGSRTRTSQRAQDTSVRGQVVLSAPGDRQSAGSRSGSGDAQGRIDNLQNELAINLEELDKSQRENQELRSRVNELEDQIATMERLIELNSEELRDLQLASEQNAQQQTGTEAPIETSDVTSAQEPAQTPTDVQASTAPATQQPTTTPAPQPRPAPQKSTLEKISDTVMANLLYIGIGVVVILGGVFFLIHRRSQAQMEEFDSGDDENFYQEEYAGDDFRDEADDTEELDEEFDIAADLEEDEEPEAPTEAETGDAVAEADIYIAYGKYDQAAEMLHKAIITDPQNIDARLKLLEVHAETKDIEKFDMEYGHLMALGDENAITKAADMRSNIPGAGQYEGYSGASSTSKYSGNNDFAAVASDNSFDSDLNLGAGDSDFGELSLDLDGMEGDDASGEFELDLDDDISADSDLSDFADEPASEGLDLNLDLEDDGDAGSSDLDLSLNFDLDEDDATGSDELGDELSLDFADDGGVDFETADDFESTEEPEQDAGDDMLGDLEFGGDDLDFEMEEDAESTSSGNTGDFDLDIDLEDATGDFDLPPAKKAPAMDFSSDDGDDFDVDMGDLDLAALDEEMDALVGGLDDLDDDDDVLASPTEVMTALDDDFSEKDLGMAELGLSQKDTLPGDEDFDGGDDDGFGDDLTFGAKSSPASAAGDEGGIGEDMNAELDFLADTDEVATKLDLARAYIDMGDKDGAKDILDEVLSEGNAEQKGEAKVLLGKLS